LFGHVSRLARGALVVVSCRGTGLELGHPLAQRLAEVGRQRPCEYLALESLPRGEAGELLEQAAGGPLEAALVDVVYADSGPSWRYLHGLASGNVLGGKPGDAGHGGLFPVKDVGGSSVLRLELDLGA
jgi:hypothetical protein